MSSLLAAAIFGAMVTQTSQYLGLSPETLRKAAAAIPETEKVPVLRALREQGIIRKMTDAQIAALNAGMGRYAPLDASLQWLAEHPTYEYIMRKQERKDGTWNDLPDRMFVRFRQSPLAIYARWLAGGRHVGQETLFDSRKNPTQMRAHAGGLLGIITVSLDLDSRTARKESNHLYSESGFQRVIDGMAKDRDRLLAKGLSPDSTTPPHSVIFEGKRYWEEVYENPGPPDFYAARTRMLFDFETGLPFVLEMWDKQGVMLERYVYEEVHWVPLSDKEFDEDNPEYRF